MTSKITLSLIFLLLLSGCASPPQTQVSQSPAPSVSSQSTNDYTDAELSAAEQLSSGKTATIQTSQGSIEIEPTVVDMADRDSPPDGQVAPQYNDPFEGWNRGTFAFNHFTYTYALIPLAKGYEYVLPEPVRDKIGNAFSNIREPLSMLSNIAAGELKDAGTNLGRFLINSTIGIFGLFDPATAWFDIPEAKQSVADTLAGYGVAPGPYLVLPILGQNNVRGSTSVIGEYLLDPIGQVSNPPDTYYLQGVDAVDSFSNRARVYEELYHQADDPYLYFRNQFLQGVKRDDSFSQPEQ